MRVQFGPLIKWGLILFAKTITVCGSWCSSYVFIMKIDYWVWRTYSKVILLVCFILLILVLIPGVGLVRGGARSWIGIGAFSIQPSEFMKFAMIIFLAKFLAERQKLITSFKRGLLPALSFVFLAFGMIMLQPDLGTGTVMVGTCIIMIFISGARVFHFAMFGLIGVAGFVGLIASAPYRMKRITSYLDPWSDPLGSGFQIIQSLLAIGPGGLFGLGLGQSRQKFLYLPEPQTDFIFAILSEELGFIGGSFVLLLFSLLLWRDSYRIRSARFIWYVFSSRYCGDDCDSSND